MGLYDMTDGELTRIPATSFAAEGILERQHLQLALRENISLIDQDLLVVAEEFGEFDEANRRIDLLCVDRSAHLVVVELKRTADGGHMELQALRYAAMVSTMTIDDLIRVYGTHLTRTGGDPDDAASTLTNWFTDIDDDTGPVIPREVRIVLVSEDFGKEITTTVLWLNDLYGLDIRCVRLTPFRMDGRLLVDVQPVVPLPEAAELTVQLRRRERAAKAASTTRDLTKYVITTPAGPGEALPKRHAVKEMVLALHAAGVSGARLSDVLPHSKLLSVDGVHEGDELVAAFVEMYPVAERNQNRWFFETPLLDPDRTWVLSNQWGIDTEATLSALVQLAPDSGITYHPA